MARRKTNKKDLLKKQAKNKLVNSKGGKSMAQKEWSKRTYVTTEGSEVVKIDVERIANGVYRWLIKAKDRSFEMFKLVLPPSDMPWKSWRLE